MLLTRVTQNPKQILTDCKDLEDSQNNWLLPCGVTLCLWGLQGFIRFSVRSVHIPLASWSVLFQTASWSARLQAKALKRRLRYLLLRTFATHAPQKFKQQHCLESGFTKREFNCPLGVRVAAAARPKIKRITYYICRTTKGHMDTMKAGREINKKQVKHSYSIGKGICWHLWLRLWWNEYGNQCPISKKPTVPDFP